MSIWKRIGQLAVLTCALAALATYPVTALGAEEHAPAAAGDHAEPNEDKANLLTFQPDLAIFSAIVFLLLLGVLGKFAWPQIAAALDERERKIAETIAAAQRLQEDAKRLLADHEAKLAAAAGEVRALLEEARRDAEHTKVSIVADAKKAAEAEVERARRDIERAKEGAIQVLAEATANVATELAGHVVASKLTAEENNRLVRDAMSKLAAAAPSKN
jgi:F-type H+-transporting ATPase subunit b